MLCSFAVKNFKSFKDWISLDLSKTKNYEFNTALIQNGLVSKALIYGYNGVGKSNFTLACLDIVLHLTDKQKQVTAYQNYLNTDGLPAEFFYTFKFDDAILKYRYGKSDYETLVYESVSINDRGIIEYDRRKDLPLTIDLPGTETLNKDINQIEISVLKYIKSNAVLNKSAESLALKIFFEFVDNMLLFWQLDNRGYQGYDVGSGNIFKDIIENNHFDDFKQFLEQAGLDSNIIYKKTNDRYLLFFKYADKEIDYWSSASTGMRSVSGFYLWFQYIKYGKNPPSLVFIDEFDAFYHAKLAQFIIREIKKIENCQIILTTHDTTVMSNNLLRPDCYFLMYKDRIQSLADSTDKELRLAHNIEKMYRAGIFND